MATRGLNDSCLGFFCTVSDTGGSDDPSGFPKPSASTARHESFGIAGRTRAKCQSNTTFWEAAACRRKEIGLMFTKGTRPKKVEDPGEIVKTSRGFVWVSEWGSQFVSCYSTATGGVVKSKVASRPL